LIREDKATRFIIQFDLRHRSDGVCGVWNRLLSSAKRDAELSAQSVIGYRQRGKSDDVLPRNRISDRRHRRKAFHLMAGLKHPVTADSRYFVVRGRLWRLANPTLSEAERATLVSELMVARSAVRSAKLAEDPAAEAAAHHAVDVAKRKLGERGPVWWTDGSPDLNRHMVKNTPYASWYSGLRTAGRRKQRTQFRDLGGVQTP
jgi:hypothetical protein